MPKYMCPLQLRMSQQTNELQLCPLNTVMKRILDRLARKDPADIFAEVVNVEEVCMYIHVCIYMSSYFAHEQHVYFIKLHKVCSMY